MKVALEELRKPCSVEWMGDAQREIMMWSKGELLWAEVSHTEASTARTIHPVEPFFRTFHHIGEQSFPFPFETSSHGGAILTNCLENERAVSLLLTFFITLFLTLPG
jgi:hypothetical protein